MTGGGAMLQWSNLILPADQVEPDLEHHTVGQGVVDAMHRGDTLLRCSGLGHGVAIFLADRSMHMWSSACHCNIIG